MKIREIFYSIYILIILNSCNIFKNLNNPPLYTTDDLIKSGDYYSSRGEFQKASKYYEAALKSNPKSEKARYKYARSLLFKFFPDFINYGFTNEINIFDTNNYFYLNSFKLLSTPQAQKILKNNTNETIFKQILYIIDSSNGILNNKGDKSISYDSLELNQFIIFNSLCGLFFSAFDLNNNNIYGDNEDLINISNNGINLNINMFTDLLANNSLFSLSSLNSSSYTNIDNIYIIMDTIQSLHNQIELLLNFMRFYLVDSYIYLNHIEKAIIRPKRFLTNINTNLLVSYGMNTDILFGYKDLYDLVNDSYTNKNISTPLSFLSKYNTVAMSNILYPLAYTLNDLHKFLTGSYAYSNSLSNFVQSKWENHNGGLKKTLETALETIIKINSLTNSLTIDNLINDPQYSNYIVISGNETNITIPPQQISNLINNITNTISPEIISNLIGQFNL